MLEQIQLFPGGQRRRLARCPAYYYRIRPGGQQMINKTLGLFIIDFQLLIERSYHRGNQSAKTCHCPQLLCLFSHV